MTNIEELRNEWLARDAKLEASLRLNTLLLKDAWLEKHRGRIVKSGFGLGQILLSVVILACVGVFLANHIGDMRFFIPAALIQAWTAVMLTVDLRQRAALRRVDYGQPLVAIQRELETQRMQRIVAFKWAFLTGQVVWWIPLFVVLFKGVLGVDLYTVSDFMPRLMAWNVIGGLAFIPLAIWVSKVLGARMKESTFMRKLGDSLAGRDFAAARALLERLARFEAEEATA